MARRSNAGALPRSALAALVAVALLLPLALGGCGLVQQEAEETPGNTTTMSSKYGGALPEQQRAAGSADVAGQSAAIAPAPGGSGVDASTVPASEKLIVRNKTLRLEVKDVTATIGKVRDLVKRDGADISQMQVATSTDDQVYRPVDAQTGEASNTALRAYMTIRVPADKYQAFIDDAAKLGTVKFQSESADDVTQQHIDLKARLDNLRAEEAQLRDFFLKAKNVTEMLQIEQELARVRGEIESMSAQVAYLERQAAMATVTIEMVEPKPLVRPTGFDWGTRDAFTKSVQAFVGTLNVLIIVLGPVLALLIFVALPAFLIARALWKRAKRRRESRTAGETGASRGAGAGPSGEKSSDADQDA